jgi:gliding motility-associated-like protein
VPGSFIFSNNSNNGSEIATTEINFGNGKDTIVNGNAPVSSDYSTPGIYTVDVTITSIYGCVYTKTFTNIVEVVENPTASFTMSSNPTSIYETTIQMQDNSSEGVIAWEWFAPDANPMTSDDQYPSFSFPEGFVGLYPITLVVTTAGGCVDTIVNFLQVNTDIIFYAPNVFTPDGDQYNQNWKFYVDGIDIYNFDLFIFNRWGEVIWESHDPSATWDGTYNGKILQDGTYTWKANVKDLNSDERKNFQGSITIIR